MIHPARVSRSASRKAELVCYESIHPHPDQPLPLHRCVSSRCQPRHDRDWASARYTDGGFAAVNAGAKGPRRLISHAPELVANALKLSKPTGKAVSVTLCRPLPSNSIAASKWRWQTAWRPLFRSPGARRNYENSSKMTWVWTSWAWASRDAAKRSGSPSPS